MGRKAWAGASCQPGTHGHGLPDLLSSFNPVSVSVKHRLCLPTRPQNPGTSESRRQEAPAHAGDTASLGREELQR